MEADKKIVTVAQSLSGLDQKQDTNLSASAKCSLEVTMSYNEIATKAAQRYYDKASGCSVKAQKDNLFDYNLFY